MWAWEQHHKINMFAPYIYIEKRTEYIYTTYIYIYYYIQWILRNLCIVRWSYIFNIDLWAKMALFREVFSGNRFVCCSLIIVYCIYSTIGRSTPSMYNLGGIITSDFASRKICHLGSYNPIWTSLPYYIYTYTHA